MLTTGTKSIFAVAGIATAMWCGQASIASAAPISASKTAPSAAVWAGQNFDGTSYQLTFDNAAKGQCINTDFTVGSAENKTKSKSKTKPWTLTAFSDKDCSGEGTTIGVPGDKVGDLTAQSFCMQQVPQKATPTASEAFPDGDDSPADEDPFMPDQSNPDQSPDDSTPTVHCGQDNETR